MSINDPKRTDTDFNNAYCALYDSARRHNIEWNYQALEFLVHTAEVVAEKDATIRWLYNIVNTINPKQEN